MISVSRFRVVTSATGENVGAAGGGGHCGAEAKALDKIVDVSEVVEDLAVAKNHETAMRDTAKQLEQAAIAGTVDARGSRDDDFDAGAARRGARNRFAFELRLLVDVARAQRRLFVGGRVLDVAVDADRAAVDDSASRRLPWPLRSTVRTAVALTARYSSSRSPACR